MKIFGRMECFAAYDFIKLHELSIFLLRACLYGGEPARVPKLARFAEMILSRVYMRL